MWFRDAAQWPVWLAVVLLWWAAGWLIAASAFRLERRERLLAGFALGMGLYGWLTNLLGRAAGPDAAFIGAAVVLLGAGIAIKGREAVPWSDWTSRESWQPVAWAFLLGWAMLRIAAGIAIFDEFTHLPLVSVIATGSIPPLYPNNSRAFFAYHYGFHLLAGSAMRLGGLFAWTASDLIKAMSWGTAVGLSWLVGKRYIRLTWGGVLSALVLVFASGTRYLFLLMPAGLLARLDQAIRLQGDEAAAGLPFSQLLGGFWQIEGDPPFPFPFAFQSGIAEPYVINHTGSNTLYVMLFLLIWLLAGRARGWRATAILAAVFAFWALTAETSYGMLAVGGVLASILLALPAFGKHRDLRTTLQQVSPVTYALLLSAPVALLQGGILTEILRGLVSGGDTGAAGFSLRWPPAILSKHLGALSLFSPFQLLAGLIELGPVILFAPWLTAWAWRKRGQEDGWLWLALVLSGWISVIVPVVLDYHSGPDISRITAFGLMVWALMLVAWIADNAAATAAWLRQAAVAGLCLACVGGIMTGASLLTAGPGMVLTEKFTPLDAELSSIFWDQLPAGAEVFDARRSRGPTLTGRMSRAVAGNQAVGYEMDPFWLEMEETPDPVQLAKNGYDYILADAFWVDHLSGKERRRLTQDCVVKTWIIEADKDFRWLLNIEGCR